jgi:hypothetical protein
VELLYDVYGNREQALLYNKKKEEEELRAKELEKLNMSTTVNNYQQEQKRKELEEILVS